MQRQSYLSKSPTLWRSKSQESIGSVPSGSLEIPKEEGVEVERGGTDPSQKSVVSGQKRAASEGECECSSESCSYKLEIKRLKTCPTQCHQRRRNRKARRESGISRRIRILGSLVPGLEGAPLTDTAFVLHETTRYIKFLKALIGA